MTKLTREAVVVTALDLLDEVGIDGITTRQLAQRLDVEQPALYWHFRNKAALLSAMAEMAMTKHAARPLPEAGDDWRTWFADNMRSFRETLLIHRDGARLHAGSLPQRDDLDRLNRKVAFLIGAGLLEMDARTAMLAGGRYTVGSVLEEQAEARTDATPAANHAAAFEAGLALIIDGLAARADHRKTVFQ